MRLSCLLLVSLAPVLSACATADCGPDVCDPMEPVNRQVHTLNKGLDTAILRPAAIGYGTAAPQPLRQGVNNFSENLSVPGTIVNDLLQANFDDALHNTVRFLVNTTLGFGGIFDTASAGGIEERPSDFGETLHVWGVGEGAYVELPVLGPSTTRDTVGMVADFFLDPVGQLLPSGNKWIPVAGNVATRLDARFTFLGTVDNVLYESADSYVQGRLFYTESRRFELGAESGDEDDAYDLYELAFE